MRVVRPKPAPIKTANEFKTVATIPKEPMDNDDTEPGIHETLHTHVRKPTKWTLMEHITVELAVTTNLAAQFDLSLTCHICKKDESYFIRGVGPTAEDTCQHILDEFVKCHMLCPAINEVAADIINEIRTQQLPGAEEIVLPDDPELPDPEECDECSSLN